MSKAVKDMLTQDLRRQYATVSSACVVDLSGLNVQAQESLRRRLRAKSARLHVVKNSLACRALANTPLEPLGAALEGPCALVTSTQSLVEVAKQLRDAAKEFVQLKLKWAVFEGDPQLLTVEQLASMRGRTELLGELANLISSPARRLAGCLGGPQARVAGCVKKLADRES